MDIYCSNLNLQYFLVKLWLIAEIHNLKISSHWTVACLQNYNGKKSRLLHYVKFPWIHNGQHDKTFLFLTKKHQKNSLAIMVEVMYCIFLKKTKQKQTPKSNKPPSPSYFLNIRNFCYHDCLRNASNSEFHTPGSYCSRPAIKALQNTDITGCTVVHLLLTCLPFGFRKHQLFRTLQLIINGEKY